jgi:hypothetical protein
MDHEDVVAVSGWMANSASQPQVVLMQLMPLVMEPKMAPPQKTRSVKKKSVTGCNSMVHVAFPLDWEVSQQM